LGQNEIDTIRALLGSKPRPIGWSERRQRLDEVGSVWYPFMPSPTFVHSSRPSPKLLIVSHHAYERKLDDGRARALSHSKWECKYHVVYIPNLAGIEDVNRHPVIHT
jgi:hypothetical protein